MNEQELLTSETITGMAWVILKNPTERHVFTNSTKDIELEYQFLNKSSFYISFTFADGHKEIKIFNTSNHRFCRSLICQSNPVDSYVLEEALTAMVMLAQEQYAQSYQQNAFVDFGCAFIVN